MEVPAKGVRNSGTYTNRWHPLSLSPKSDRSSKYAEIPFAWRNSEDFRLFARGALNRPIAVNAGEDRGQ